MTGACTHGLPSAKRKTVTLANPASDVRPAYRKDTMPRGHGSVSGGQLRRSTPTTERRQCSHDQERDVAQFRHRCHILPQPHLLTTILKGEYQVPHAEHTGIRKVGSGRRKERRHKL